MIDEVKEALNTFVVLLPEYFPAGLGNPNDLNRWKKVCYLACKFDSPIVEDDLMVLLKEKYSDFDDAEIQKSANSYMNDYYTYMLMLDYLKDNDYLK